MQEGLANLVLVTPAMTLLRAKVEVTIPRKRRGSCTQHEKVGKLSAGAQAQNCDDAEWTLDRLIGVLAASSYETTDLAT